MNRSDQRESVVAWLTMAVVIALASLMVMWCFHKLYGGPEPQSNALANPAMLASQPIKSGSAK